MSKGLELTNMTAFDTSSSFERALAASIGEVKGKECVRRLLGRYGSVASIMSGSIDDICKFGKINVNTALLIKLIGYVNSRRVTDAFEMNKAYTEIELREYLAALFLGASVETVYALFLDDANRIIGVEHISEGTINTSDIVPRKLLELAKKKNSKRLIVAHNHPNGRAVPSKDDVMTTGRLVNVFGTVGVRIAGHYIVADGEVARIESEMLYNPDYNGDTF